VPIPVECSAASGRTPSMEEQGRRGWPSHPRTQPHQWKNRCVRSKKRSLSILLRRENERSWVTKHRLWTA